MRALELTGRTDGRGTVVLGERPDPTRAPGEVLVRIKAGSLNRVDLYMRDTGAGITHALPLIMGVDGAGVVEAVDPGESGLRVGDRVLLHPGLGCGRCEFCLRGDSVLCLRYRILGEHVDGTFADLVSLPAANVFPIPDGLSFEEAACLPVAYLTAWRMVVTKAAVRPTDTVLIFGVGGGVSLAALQICRMIGARVIATSTSDAKLERARALGAAVTVNARNADVVGAVMEATRKRGVDVVVENVGQATWDTALRSVVRGGTIVTCGATSGGAPSADLHRVFIRQLRILGSTLGTPGDLLELLRAVQGNGLRPVIDSRFPLDRHGEAFDRLAGGEQSGKVVLTL